MITRKSYELALPEMYLIREALIEYKHRLGPITPESTAARVRNYRSIAALADQFINDVRLFRE